MSRLETSPAASEEIEEVELYSTPPLASPSKRFSCPECPEAFNLRHNLSLHLASHQKSPFVCPDCGKKFGRLASLRAHLDKHRRDDSLACPRCEDAFFDTEAELEEHLDSQHRKRKSKHQQKSSASTDGGDMFCTQCRKKLKSRQDYLLHQRQHRKLNSLLKTKRHRRRIDRRGEGGEILLIQSDSGVKKINNSGNTCKFCGKVFRKPSQCQRHERIHTGEKPFQCGHCDKAFSQKNSLEMHMRRHLNVKPFSCELCDMKFSQKCNMHSHILRVHSGFCSKEDEPYFKCPGCPCTFRKVGSLNAHVIRLHSSSPSATAPASAVGAQASSVVLTVKEDDGKFKDTVIVQSGEAKNRRYLCQKCPKTFQKPSSLARHQRRHARAEKAMTKRPPPPLPSRSPQQLDTPAVLKPSELLSSGLGKGLGLSRTEKGIASVTEDGLIVIDPNDLGVDFSHLTFEAPPPHPPPSVSLALRRSTSPSLAPDKGEAPPPELDELKREQRRAEAEAEAGGGGTLVDDDDDDDDPAADFSNYHVPGESLDILRQSLTDDSFPLPENPPPAATDSSSKLDPPPGPVVVSAETISQKLFRELVYEKDFEGGEGTEAAPDPQPRHRNACTKCGKSFKKPSDLIRHERVHTKEKPYSCPECERSFSLKSTLTSHLRTHQGGEERLAAAVTCHICSLRFVKKSALKSHLRIHTGGRPYQCQECPERFRTPSMRKAHRDRCHRAAKEKREERDAETDEEEEEEEEEEIEEEEESTSPAKTVPVVDPWKVKLVEGVTRPTTATVPTPATLDLQQHNQPPPMLISVPAASLTSALNAVSEIGVPVVGSTLKLQLDFGAGGAGPPMPPPGGGPSSTVTHLKVDEQLLRQLATGDSISLVIQPQQQEKVDQVQVQRTTMVTKVTQPPPPPLPAPEPVQQPLLVTQSQPPPPSAPPLEPITTGVVPPTAPSLEDSIVIQDKSPTAKKDPPPQPSKGPGSSKTCPECGKTFSKPFLMRRHLRSHTGERPFTCEECGKSFSQSSSLDLHRRALHGGERPFVCPFCAFAFTQKCNLKTHIVRAHQEQAQRLVQATGMKNTKDKAKKSKAK